LFPSTPLKDSAGFTLIEALVALAIVAIALSSIGTLIASSAHGARSIEGRLTRLETARAVMSALPARDQLVPGTLSGEIANHPWRVDVLPFVGGGIDPELPSPWAPQSVVVTVQPTGAALKSIRPLTAEQQQMRMPKFDSAPMAGFTLIEALVATALMGFILAALATITAQWLPNWNHGVVRVQRNEQVALGLERLAADLAVADFISANNQTRKPFFDGASRSVTFVRTALGPDTGPGLEFVRIAEISSERGPVLVRTRAPFVPGIDRQPNFTDPVVLLRAPYRLSFSYAGTDRNWRDDWREQFPAVSGRQNT
jgi:general secretion pathway protein J